MVDHGVDDKRVLIVESEQGNVLQVLAREGNTLSGVLRLAWDGDNRRTMTKNNPARASNPHVSLIGHVTAEELGSYLKSVEIFNGLGNRILWVCVRRSKRLPFGGSVDGEQVQALGARLAVALAHARGVGLMKWTNPGRVRWESEYDNLTESRPGLWGAITSQAEVHVLRLAMIYAVLEESSEIADTHIQSALALWKYCDRSAASLFGVSVGDRDADAILRCAPGSPGRDDAERNPARLVRRSQAGCPCGQQAYISPAVQPHPERDCADNGPTGNPVVCGRSDPAWNVKSVGSVKSVPAATSAPSDPSHPSHANHAFHVSRTENSETGNDQPSPPPSKARCRVEV